MIKYIGYPKCSTSKKGEKWMKENGIEYEFRDISKENPSERELREWLKVSDVEIKKMFNTSGLKYRELNLKENLKEMSDDEKISLLATDGMLVKRPIIIGKDFVLFGFKEEQWKEKIIG